jgi:hypothetical protein
VSGCSDKSGRFAAGESHLPAEFAARRSLQASRIQDRQRWRYIEGWNNDEHRVEIDPETFNDRLRGECLNAGFDLPPRIQQVRLHTFVRTSPHEPKRSRAPDARTVG